MLWNPTILPLSSRTKLDGLLSMAPAEQVDIRLLSSLSFWSSVEVALAERRLLLMLPRLLKRGCRESST